jgi:KDO2-lipid IV(A) lauroyltransferase
MSFWLYLGATWLAPLLPERLGYWLFARLGDLAYVFGKQARGTYLKNLEHVLGPEATDADRKRITRHAFRNLLKNYFDLFRGHLLNERQLRAQLTEVVGFEHLEEAVAQGKGIVTGSAHFGNFNLFIHLAALYLGGHRQIVVPTERLSPERLYELVRKQRAAQGIEIVPVDTAGRALIKALRNGGMIGLALELDVTHTGIVVDFFGAPARLPDGAPALALKYQAPLVIGFTRRLPDNRCKVVIEPALQLVSTGDLRKDSRAGVEKIARRLEDWISRYPEQWLMFQPIWEEDKQG